MNIHIYNYARSFIVAYWNDDSEWEDACPYSTIDAAVEAARNEIDVRQQAISAAIWDADTGEVYMVCGFDEEDIAEEDYGAWDDWGYNEDEGFDPYLGEYTWDC